MKNRRKRKQTKKLEDAAKRRREREEKAEEKRLRDKEQQRQRRYAEKLWNKWMSDYDYESQIEKLAGTCATLKKKVESRKGVVNKEIQAMKRNRFDKTFEKQVMALVKKALSPIKGTQKKIMMQLITDKDSGKKKTHRCRLHLPTLSTITLTTLSSPFHFLNHLHPHHITHTHTSYLPIHTNHYNFQPNNYNHNCNHHINLNHNKNVDTYLNHNTNDNINPNVNGVTYTNKRVIYQTTTTMRCSGRTRRTKTFPETATRLGPNVTAVLEDA